MNILHRAMNKNIVLIIGLIYLIYHLITLDISPIVWYDETIINAITRDFIQNGTFYSWLDPAYTKGQEALVYGPTFFFINGIVIKILGNGLWAGRLLGLISGLLILFYFYIKYKDEVFKGLLPYLVLLSFALDPFFNASMHKGRYDTFGVLLYLISLGLIDSYLKSQSRKYLLYSSLVYAVCALTSMRFIPFGLPIFLYLSLGLITNKHPLKSILINTALWVAIPILSYIAWIFIKFHSIENYMAYFQNVKETNPGHLFGSLYIPLEVKPLVFSTILILLTGLWSTGKKLFTPELVGYIVYIILFYIIVGDVGPYSIMVIPFYFMILMHVITRAEWKNHKAGAVLVKTVLVALFLFNGFTFLLKVINLSLTSNQRNHRYITEFIQKHVPAHSNIIGDPRYYYASVNNECLFQYCNPVGFQSEVYNIVTIEEYRRTVFNYDYLMVSYDLLADKRYKDVLPQYLNNSKLIVVDSLVVPTNKWMSALSNIEKGYNFSENGYNGILYKRVKD